MSQSGALSILPVTRNLSCPITCYFTLRLSHTFRCRIVSVFCRHCRSPCDRPCLNMSTNALTSFDVRHNCLHCYLRCHFSVVFNVTLTPASASHYRGFGFTLPRFTGFTQQLVHVLSTFLPQLWHAVRFSIVIAAVVNTGSALCMSSLLLSPPSWT